jgi:hypothetical protein
MLSNMESNDLAVQQRLAASLRLPAGFAPVLGGGMALHLATAAVGIRQQTVAGLGLVAVGLVLFGLSAAWVLTRFRAVNGATVGGLTSRAVLGTSHTSSAVHLASFAATTWAAFAEQWWLVALCALAGGGAYVACALAWWRGYQRDPAAHARGESRLVLGLLALTAVLAAVVLVLGA